MYEYIEIKTEPTISKLVNIRKIDIPDDYIIYDDCISYGYNISNKVICGEYFIWNDLSQDPIQIEEYSDLEKVKPKPPIFKVNVPHLGSSIGVVKHKIYRVTFTVQYFW